MVEWIVAVVISLVLILGIGLGLAHKRDLQKAECEGAGGQWLPRNHQCLEVNK